MEEEKYSNMGYVVRDRKIVEHFDPDVRQLAGRKVMIMAETLEPVYNHQELFGHRVTVIPFSVPNPRPVAIMLPFVRAKFPLMKAMIK